MRRNVTVLVAALVAVLSTAACSSSPPISMPNVVGKHLDVALSDVERAGVLDDVDVVGGGVFGIVDKSNWTVCTQEPAAGAAVDKAPRVTVERTCPGSPDAAAAPTPEATGADEEQPEVTETADDVVDEFFPTTTYGKTLPFEANRTCCPGEPMKLDITVSAPKTFTPSDPAGATQAANVYFTVTMKNTGTTVAQPSNLVDVISGKRSSAEGTGTEGDEFFNTDDGFGGPGDIPVGKSSTYRMGFSVADATDVTFAISPYGLGGNTLTWTR